MAMQKEEAIAEEEVVTATTMQKDEAIARGGGDVDQKRRTQPAVGMQKGK